MMLLKSTIAALSVLAALAPAVDARSSLTRRGRCRANHGSGNNGAGGGAGGGGGAINVGDKPTSTPEDAPEPSTPAPSGCFPSKSFNVPDSPKGISVNDWWCERSSEYAFMGFSYAVDGCPSESAMVDNFKQMKNQFNARYVRTYGACDRDSFWSDFIDAAYEAGVGTYPLVWFGFNGDNKWEGRLSKLLNAIDSNPRSAYVVRTIQLGSEPIFDHAISAGALSSKMRDIRNRVKSKGIHVATSEMPFLLKQNGGVLDAVDEVNLNLLPFFSQDATHGSNANVMSDLNSMAQATGNDKKVIMTQTGWASNRNVWQPNSRSAVVSVDSEKGYYDLLDSLCPTFKKGPLGGFAWFAHVYDDRTLSGWGITNGGTPKFDFSPRIKC